MINNRGIVYTFYSFKGGVGRSMALANVAALLAKSGSKVLIIDWDLEAPGLEKYFSNNPSSLSSPRTESFGIVDIVCSYSNDEIIDWRSCLISAYPFKEGKPISILTAGKESNDYVMKLQSINWEFLFKEKDFGFYLEKLREEWIKEFDFVLIDSRTGITDIGGICTIHLPDALVLLFSANEQSLTGVINVMNRVLERHKTLPLDRSKILAVPVPSRFDNVTEYKLANKWKTIFAKRLANIYKDWLPDKITATDVLEKLFIPYIPFWSFGEGLPVVTEGTSDPRTLGFAYDLLAKLLSNRLQWNESLSGDINVSNNLSSVRLNEMANSIYNKFPDYEKEDIKNIFLRLISPVNDTKLAVKMRDFEKDKDLYFIDKLIEGGLLYRSKDSLTKEPTIEISHEALILNWGKLKSWIDENREFIVWRQELNLKANEWKDNNHNKAELLTGSTLKKAENISKLRSNELNMLEREFIKRSVINEKNQVYKKFIPSLSGIIIAGLGIVIAGYFYQSKQEQMDIRLQQQQEQTRDLLYQVRRQNMINDSLNMQYRLLLEKLSNVEKSQKK